jgi:membrane protein required for colicin V production
MQFLASIQVFDIIFAIVAVIFIVAGVRRGLIGELFRFASLILGFVAALLYHKPASRLLSFLAVPVPTKGAIAFILVFIVSVLIILLAGWLLQKVIRLTPMGIIDHISGAVIGLAKAALVAWIFVLSSESSPFTQTKKAFRKSPTYSLLASIPFKYKVPYIELGPRTVVRNAPASVPSPIPSAVIAASQKSKAGTMPQTRVPTKEIDEKSVFPKSKPIGK